MSKVIPTCAFLFAAAACLTGCEVVERDHGGGEPVVERDRVVERDHHDGDWREHDAYYHPHRDDRDDRHWDDR